MVMKAVVVYQSIWGNTAAIARAIAEGIGAGAKAVSTTEATPDVLKGVELVVAGSPIHAFNLPSADSVRSTQTRASGPVGVPTDVSHRLMRDWLLEVPTGTGAAAAAFDTRVRGPLGRGGAKRILKALDRAGLTPIAKPRGFYVAMGANQGVPKGTLLEGEVERARQWGKELAAIVA
jgi:hypothetical protein